MRSFDSQMDAIARRHESSSNASAMSKAGTDINTESSITAPVLAALSAILGVFNPKIIEWVLWYLGNPLPYGSKTIIPSAICAAVSAVTGTIALFMIEGSRSKCNFRYVALVGAGVSYPFILYYSISVIALFSKLGKVR